MRLLVVEDDPDLNRQLTTALTDAGYVVDSPGLREIGMWGLASEHLDECFREFREYIPLCRFGNCTHRVEPGCAVRRAVEDGALSPERYDSYLRLREEIEQALRDLRQGTFVWSGPE